MLSKDLYDLAESFTALSLSKDHEIVITPAHADNFGRCLHSYAMQAEALEGKPVPSGKILLFPDKQKANSPAPAPGGDAA
jgi:hypothetical protein